MTLGNIAIRYGTANNDTITGSNLQAVLGLSGNDRLTAGSTTNFLAGGFGDDTYVVRVGEGATIFESGGVDTVIFPFSTTSNTGFIFTLDNRHLGIGDRATKTGALIIDWKNPANRVEKFEFVDGTATYEQVVSQYTSSLSYIGNIAIQQTNPNADGYLFPATGLTPTTFNSFLDDISALAVGTPLTTVSLADFKKDPGKYMGSIRDYDANNLGSGDTWKSLGDVDIQGDGDLESILVNPAIGRFASVGSINGNVDFSKYGLNGDTRVVGIYIDPTLKNSPQNINGPFDSQRRFQDDLRNDNLQVLAAGDYNKDGFQDLYFKLGDGSAVLRALMFKDGNIQYANYQSKSDLANFMTANNVSSSVWGGWL
ncbi:hypothetical protein [Chamaesiphon sp.]|uniref:hypothetical protein n=1 Tax=Chamaesiphon sp. TaxID=2814140 RepID=UPI003593129C